MIANQTISGEECSYQNRNEKWYTILEKVKTYINENKKLPSCTDKDPEIKTLGHWIQHQQKNYFSQKFIKKNTNIIEAWDEFIEKYHDYFKSNKEIWYNTLNKLKSYINENKKLPSQTNKDPEIKKLAKWLIKQQYYYPLKEKIMKLSEVRNAWEEFLKETDCFKSSEEIWYNTLNKVKIYINENKKRPSSKSKDPEIKKLGKWIYYQKNNYSNKTSAMYFSKIRNDWEKFKYETGAFKHNTEIWYSYLEKTKNYIDKNGKKPLYKDKDPEIKKLGKWIQQQQDNYSNKKNIMKNLDIRNAWEIFIEKYKNQIYIYKKRKSSDFDKLEDLYYINNDSKKLRSN